MDIPLVAGTVSTVVFAASNLPMLRKALRTGDVSSYSVPSLVMINVANLVYSLYVFTLPIGPIWALHSFYVVSCAIMLVLCIAQRRPGRNEAGDVKPLALRSAARDSRRSWARTWRPEGDRDGFRRRRDDAQRTIASLRDQAGRPIPASKGGARIL
jgi:uncharacterized protein with PQ loop repeat